MIDVVYRYQNLLENLGSLIDASNYKKEYFFRELNVTRQTFYNKLKKKNFTIGEMLKLMTILFLEEAKAIEMMRCLMQS